MKKLPLVLLCWLGVLAMQAFSCQTSYARTPPLQSTIIEIPVNGGCVGVEVVPDREGSLVFSRTSGNVWRLSGNGAGLIGRPYSIRLTNRTPLRLKIVVGVDGLNIYQKNPVKGRSDRDVGSILAPWGERRLEGWQLDHRSAERFVFSPVEWSEGRGTTDDEIGRVAVHVYTERELSWRDRWRGGSERRKSHRESEDSRCAPEAAPGIGTTSGDEITSHVRTVHFAASTTYPVAEAIINYGGGQNPPPPWVFGMDLGQCRDGSVVNAVDPGTLADEAGLQCGDVIVRIDGESTPTPKIVRSVLDSKRSGDRTFFTIRRGRHEIALKARM